MKRIEQSMEAESFPGSREHAISVYRRTLLQAAELGAQSKDPDLVRRVKRQLGRSDLFFLLTNGELSELADLAVDGDRAAMRLPRTHQTTMAEAAS
jgi:hypothetical protein